MTFFESVSAYFRLWRYQPAVVLGLFSVMYLGWVTFSWSPQALERQYVTKVALGWVASVSVLLAMFLINDATDREIDKVVHPERPIPRGLCRWHHICVLGIVLLVAAVLVSLGVNLRCATVAILMGTLTMVHYGYTKRSLSIAGASEIITPMMSALFPLYAFSVPESQDWRSAFLWVAFIYCADFAQDLLGGIHDEAGDRQQNVRTFAIHFGQRVTLRVSLFSFLVANLAAILIYRTSSLGPTYLLLSLGLTAFLLGEYAKLFRMADGPDLARRAGRVNHLGGGYFFLVAASTFVDFTVRQVMSALG